MKIRFLIIGLSIFIPMLASGASSGNEPEQATIDVSAELEVIPFYLQIYEFIKTYNGQLDIQLSSNEVANMYFAAREHARLEATVAALTPFRIQNTLCQYFSSDDDNPWFDQQGFIDAWEELFGEDEEHRQALANRFYNGLSRNTKALIESHIRENITPDMTYQERDIRTLLDNRQEKVRRKLSPGCTAPKLKGAYIIDSWTDQDSQIIHTEEVIQ